MIVSGFTCGGVKVNVADDAYSGKSAEELEERRNAARKLARKIASQALSEKKLKESAAPSEHG